jgi:hypothetical protein
MLIAVFRESGRAFGAHRQPDWAGSVQEACEMGKHQTIDIPL